METTVQHTYKIDVEEERKEIIRRYRKLLRHAKPFLKDNDAKTIKKAFYTSLDAHKEVRRKSGEPYIYHPLEVAQICVAEIGLGTTSISMKPPLNDEAIAFTLLLYKKYFFPSSLMEPDIPNSLLS